MAESFATVRALDAGGMVLPLPRAPSYASVPPVFANADQIVAPWRDKFHDIVTRSEAALPPAQIVRLHDAILYQNGYICTADGRIVEETIRNAKNVAPPDLSRLRHCPGSIAVLRKPGDNNFGHWLVELLPRVLEFRAALAGQHLRFGIPAHPKSMVELRKTTLAMLGVQPDEIMLLDETPVQFDEVIFITSNSIHSHSHDHIGLTAVAETVLRQVAHDAPSRRLYVARGGDHKRRLLNEDAVLPGLLEQGFEVIRPETLPFHEQVKLFAEAQIVVGVTGAALTNILWSPPGCPIISLLPNHGHEFFFWDIAGIKGQPFTFLFGESTDPSLRGHSDFTIDPALLFSTLRAQAEVAA